MRVQSVQTRTHLAVAGYGCGSPLVLGHRNPRSRSEERLQNQGDSCGVEKRAQNEGESFQGQLQHEQTSRQTLVATKERIASRLPKKKEKKVLSFGEVNNCSGDQRDAYEYD